MNDAPRYRLTEICLAVRLAYPPHRIRTPEAFVAFRAKHHAAAYVRP